jgi:RimJ/RimL family protein N-acetyltransferase
MIVVLETERLALRQFAESDADNLLALERDAEVMRHLGRKPLADAEACRRHIVSSVLPYYDRPGGHGVWAVLEKTSGEFIGVCSLKPALDARYAAGMGFAAGEVEIGFGLRHSSWGRGYATEVVRALVHRALGEMTAQSVVASVSVANAGSIRVLEKAGLCRVGGLIWLPDEEGASFKYVLSRDQLRA